MNKEQQELLDEVYEDYVNWWEYSDDSINLTEGQSSKWLKLVDGGLQWAPLTKEEFINKYKTNPKFSEKFGLKIKERMILEQVDQNNLVLKGSTSLYPTKLIALTYDSETIKNYEQIG